jgi:exopolysaccharide biosynthesis predicted pyruvyltransferase EpsI
MEENVFNGDRYELLKRKQLALAQESNVLLFSRDKVSLQLARKLKPEFGLIP